MKTKQEYLEVSEFGFPVDFSFYVGIDILENQLSKNIVSMEGVNYAGTNMLDLVPIVANIYYFFKYIILNQMDQTSLMSVAPQPLKESGAYVVNIYRPIAMWNATTAIANYSRTYKIEDLWTRGFYGSANFTNIDAIGVKIITS